jgi:hypothetical protein
MGPYDSSGRGFFEAVVKVLARAQFERKETLHVAGSPMPKDVKRQFQAALVEVMDGPKKGEQGWVPISYQDPAAKVQTYLGDVPANHQARQATQAQTAADLQNSVDLVISIYEGQNTPSSGRLYTIL